MTDKSRSPRQSMWKGVEEAIERTDARDRRKPPRRHPSQAEAQRWPRPEQEPVRD